MMRRQLLVAALMAFTITISLVTPSSCQSKKTMNGMSGSRPRAEATPTRSNTTMTVAATTGSTEKTMNGMSGSSPTAEATPTRSNTTMTVAATTESSASSLSHLTILSISVALLIMLMIGQRA
ncbi:uncharacterized protein [Ptychodera flava]|uniref:uncharacterized protein isoform X2 n=1 Tax=Ptychodera flava TaxID=63121 RepID=UPI00396A592F